MTVLMQLERGSELRGPAPYETPYLTPHLTPHLTPPPSCSQAAHPIAFGEGSGSDPESGPSYPRPQRFDGRLPKNDCPTESGSGQGEPMSSDPEIRSREARDHALS